MFIVSYIVSYLGLGLVLSKYLILVLVFGFFKYPFYSRILIYLVLLYTKLKLLLSLGRYSTVYPTVSLAANLRKIAN